MAPNCNFFTTIVDTIDIHDQNNTITESNHRHFSTLGTYIANTDREDNQWERINYDMLDLTNIQAESQLVHRIDQQSRFSQVFGLFRFYRSFLQIPVDVESHIFGDDIFISGDHTQTAYTTELMISILLSPLKLPIYKLDENKKRNNVIKKQKHEPHKHAKQKSTQLQRRSKSNLQRKGKQQHR